MENDIEKNNEKLDTECAFIYEGGPCNQPVGGGLNVFILNRSAEVSYVVKILVKWTGSLEGQQYKQIVLEPGEEDKPLGCTVGYNMGAINYTYEVVACRAI
jgi:hypothetical protein